MKRTYLNLTARDPAKRVGSGIDFVEAQRLMKWVGVLFVLTSIGLATWSARPAAAAATDFCPPSVSTMYLGGGQSCVSARFYYLTKVWFVTRNGDGVDHCAVGKQYSDGGGANVIPAACGTAEVQATPCVSARVGYAKGINNSASGHYFYGKAFYYDCNY